MDDMAQVDTAAIRIRPGGTTFLTVAAASG